jgi:hypothetical protein
MFERASSNFVWISRITSKYFYPSWTHGWKNEPPQTNFYIHPALFSAGFQPGKSQRLEMLFESGFHDFPVIGSPGVSARPRGQGGLPSVDRDSQCEGAEASIPWNMPLEEAGFSAAWRHTGTGRPCAAQEWNRDDFYSIIRWDLVHWLVGLIDCLKICSMLTDWALRNCISRLLFYCSLSTCRNPCSICYPLR